MQLTTSKRISLKFTLYTIAIVFFFGFLINVLFFQQRYNAESERLISWRMQPNRPHLQSRFPMPTIDEIPLQQELLTELKNKSIFPQVARLDDQYIMFSQAGNIVRVSNITRMIEAQEKMVVIFLVLLIVFSVGTYFLSIIFVQSSLKHIKQLVAYVKTLDIHTLHTPVPLSWPPTDEIRTIGTALQKMLTTIKEQTDSLKDFVTHASHEMKTPLMSLNAVIDAGTKTGDHVSAFASAKKVLHNINNMFETLLAITKWEYHQIQKKRIDIAPLILNIYQEIAPYYQEKWIACKIHIPKTYMLYSNEELFHIIFFNLLQNAYKYADVWWTIQIRLQKDRLVISNSGIGIRREYLRHIWDKFWKQHDENTHKEWFGLWLYLVKLLVHKHDRTIDVMSDPGKITSFTLSFDQ